MAYDCRIFAKRQRLASEELHCSTSNPGVDALFLPNFGQNPTIDTHRYTFRNHLRHLTSGEWAEIGR